MPYSKSCCKSLPEVASKKLVSVRDKFLSHSIVCYDIPYKHIDKLKRVSVLDKRNKIEYLLSLSTITKILSYVVCVRGSVEGGSPVTKSNDTECHGASGIWSGRSSL